MAYQDMVEDEKEQLPFAVKMYTYKGKNFLLYQDDPNGMWTIRHTNGKKRVSGASGLYTGIAQAKRAIHQLPTSVFTASLQKTILTPKGPKESNGKERGTNTRE